MKTQPTTCGVCGDPAHQGRPCNNPKVKELYPRSAALGLRFVYADPKRQHDYEGFDSLKVLEVLEQADYDALIKLVVAHGSMFACDHRRYPADHKDETLRGSEVPCFYAQDVEDYLDSLHNR